MHRRHFLEALASTAVCACAPGSPGRSPTPPAAGPRPAAAVPRAALAALSDKTYGSRLERVRQLTRDAGGSCALVTSGTTNFEYLTGAALERSERLIALAVPLTGEPIVVAPSFELERVRRTVRVAAVLRGWQESESPYEVLRDALGPAARGPLVVEPHTEYGTARAVETTLAGARLVDGASAFASLRVVKDDDEIARIRRAIALTHEVFERAFAALRPGIRDRDVSAGIARAFKDAGAPGYALVQFGVLSALPHGAPEGAALQNESAVLIDGGCCVEGYWSDITRTRWFGGTPPDAFLRVHDVVQEAQRAGIARAQAGVAAQEVDRAARAIITRSGFGPQFTHRTGHGLGMDGHEPIYLVEGNQTPLVPGCVFTVEPGIYLPGQFGVRIEDDVQCTPGGAVVLTGA